jgi:hypothetical protein
MYLQFSLFCLVHIQFCYSLEEKRALSDCKKGQSYEGDTCEFFAINWGLTIPELNSNLGHFILICHNIQTYVQVRFAFNNQEIESVVSLIHQVPPDGYGIFCCTC